MIRAAAAFLIFLGVAGCGPALREQPPGGGAGEGQKALARLREAAAALRSYRCEGTMLLRTETERHFIHFRAFHRAPDRLRVDLDVDGPLGLGGGRLSLAERGDSLEALLPEEEIPRRGRIGDPAFDLLAPLGLAAGDAAHLLAPITGDPSLYSGERLLASGRDGRSGAVRLVLRRRDGNREVLLVDPVDGRIRERRIARPDGTVLLVCIYEGGEGERLFPEETEARVPAEETVLRVRYGETALGPDLPDRIFRAGAALP